MDSKNIFKRILYYMNPKHIEPKMVKLWAFWIVFWVVLFLVPTKMVTGSFWILVPLAGLFVYALVTKDVMQSLVLGTFSYRWKESTVNTKTDYCVFNPYLGEGYYT